MSKYVHQSWIGRNMMQRIYLQNNIFQGSVQLWSLYLANIWNIFAGIGRQLINEKKSMKWRKIRKRNDFLLGKDRKQLLYRKKTGKIEKKKKQERIRKRNDFLLWKDPKRLYRKFGTVSVHSSFPYHHNKHRDGTCTCG